MAVGDFTQAPQGAEEQIGRGAFTPLEGDRNIVIMDATGSTCNFVNMDTDRGRIVKR